MKATDILDRITPLKRRMSGHQWYILLTLCANPDGMTCNALYQSMWCGKAAGVLRTLAEFKRRGLTTRSLGTNDTRGRKPIIHTPTPKAFTIMGLEQ